MRVHEYGKTQVDTWHIDPDTLGEEEAAVRVLGAPLNLIDPELIAGKVRWHAQLPFIPGIEGYGEVIAVGKKLNKNLVGRKALIESLKGVYTTHNVYSRKELYLLDEDVQLERVAHSFFYNPVTAYGLLEAVKGSKPRALVQTGASSNVGRWLALLAHQRDIATISVVRKAHHIPTLKEHAADVVLDSSAPDFDDAFRNAVRWLQPTVLLDALSGGFAARLLGQMPPRSGLWVYGTLEAESVEGLTADVLNLGRTAGGYFVCSDLIAKEKHEDLEKVLNKLYKGEKAAKERVREFGLDQFNDALQQSGEKQEKFVIRP